MFNDEASMMDLIKILKCSCCSTLALRVLFITSVKNALVRKYNTCFFFFFGYTKFSKIDWSGYHSPNLWTEVLKEADIVCAINRNVGWYNYKIFANYGFNKVLYGTHSALQFTNCDRWVCKAYVLGTYYEDGTIFEICAIIIGVKMHCCSTYLTTKKTFSCIEAQI